MDTQAAEQDQRRHDQEAAADADEARDDADDQAVGGDLPGFSRCVRCVAQFDGSQHHVGREQHDQRKQGELDNARHPGGNDRAEIGAGHAGHTEDEHVAPVDQLRPHILQAAGQRDVADDEQRSGNGDFLVLADQVDEHGHGDDRTAGTEQSEADADGDGARPGEDGCGHSERSVQRFAAKS